MISEATINKVRELAIEEILKPYVRLSRKGSTLMGICPFHEERTGSFAVTPGRNLFHCFSGNRGGDGIAFIMEKENLSFLDAVLFLAKNHCIAVEYTHEEQSEEQAAEARRKEKLLIALDLLQRFFADALKQQEFCSVAGIGYAPKDGRAFIEYCQRKGIGEEALFELGMLLRSEDGHAYAMFRQRIMIGTGGVVSLPIPPVISEKTGKHPSTSIHAQAPYMPRVKYCSALTEQAASGRLTTSSWWRVRRMSCECSP